MWKYGSHNLFTWEFPWEFTALWGGIPSRVETHQWSSLFGSPLADVSDMGPCAVNAMDCGPCATPRVAAGLAVRSKRSALLKSCVKVMLRPWSFWEWGSGLWLWEFQYWLDGKSTVDGLFRAVVYFYSLASHAWSCVVWCLLQPQFRKCVPLICQISGWLWDAKEACLRFGTEVYASGS